MGNIQTLNKSETEAPSNLNSLKDMFLQKEAKIVAIGPEATVAEAVELMIENKIGSVLVIEGDKLVGVFTERDVMHRVVHPNLSPPQVKLKEVMTTKIIKGGLYMSLHDAASLMHENRIRHLPIFDGEQLIGVISPGDLIAWKLQQSEKTIHQMEDYFLH